MYSIPHPPPPLVPPVCLCRPHFLIKLQIWSNTSYRYQVLLTKTSPGTTNFPYLGRALVTSPGLPWITEFFFLFSFSNRFYGFVGKFTFNPLTSANMALCILFIALKSFFWNKLKIWIQVIKTGRKKYTKVHFYSTFQDWELFWEKH